MNVVQKVSEHLNISEYTVFSLAANAYVGSEFVSVPDDFKLYQRYGCIPLYVLNYARQILKGDCHAD